MDKELLEIKQEVETLTEKLSLLKKEMGKVIVGQEDTIDQLLISFLAGGHALLEGVPGLAKTLMIKDPFADHRSRVQKNTVYARPDAVRHYRY